MLSLYFHQKFGVYMKKRFVAIAFVLIILLSFCACDFQLKPVGEMKVPSSNNEPKEYEGYDRIDSGLLDFDMDLYTRVELTKGFESLQTDAQRECYKLLEENVYYISEVSEDSAYHIMPVKVKKASLRESELHLVISAFAFDNPQIFWIDNSFSYYANSSETYLQLASIMSATEAAEALEKMKRELSSMFSQMPGNLSQFDRELFVHDKLIEACEYADEEVLSSNEARVYTSYGAIVDGLAVCEGYSRAAQFILSLVGVESYYVYGRGNNELHMWNSVFLDDGWYYLDVTWDDKGDEGASHNHFNITTEQLLSDRSILPLYSDLSEDEIVGEGSTALNFNLFVPDCSSDDMSFYSYNSVTVTGFDDENLSNIAQAMVEAVNSNKKAVYLYIDPYYLDFDYASDNLFYSGDYAIFTCVDRANEMLLNDTISNEYVSTEESQEQSVITVYIEY